jgi:putative glycosyltransferase (TIGR04348 family)
VRAGLIVRLVTPAAPGSRSGNRVTAERWAAMLERLGCRVVIDVAGSSVGQPPDVLVALHARRSHAEVAEFARAAPGRPIVVGLAGTDVYVDIPAGDADALDSIARADRIVALQPRAASALPASARARVRVIHQSCALPDPLPPFDPAPAPGRFRVAVVAHLRGVKDPLAAAEAARLLPADTPVEVVHVGDALDADLAAAARAAGASSNGRYRWLGPVARERALALVAQSRVLCLTSLAEGGANAVTEALACGTPVISSRIEGSLGLLGEDYPGFFDVGDRAGLAGLLERAARDESFLGQLARRCAALAHLADPATELASWRALVDEIAP